MQSLPLYTHSVHTLLNDNIVEIETSDGIFSLTFAVNEFSGLLLHPSISILLIQFVILIKLKIFY